MFVADGICCTSVVALIANNTIHCGNAGDSRYIPYTGNKVIPLSNDNKPSLKSESDCIAGCGGTIGNGRVDENLNRTRTIGDLVYKAVD